MEDPEQTDGHRPKRMQRPGGRTERVRQQVVTATVALLAEDGVSGVSVDSVANRSGVARTTIYRRWGNPQALMLEALLQELAPRASRIADTGSLRGDLRALLADVTAFSTSEQGRGIMQAVFIQRNAEHITSEARSYWDQRFAAAGEIVRRAVARGELADGNAERMIIELAAAPVYLRLFITREPVDDEYLDEVVSFILAGCGAREAGVDESRPEFRHG